MSANSILISIFTFFIGLGICYGQTEEVIEQIPESVLTHSVGAMGTENGTVKVEDVYSFDHSVKLRSTVYDKKGEESQNSLVDIFYSDGSTIFGMSMSSPHTGITHIVYDYENGQMITMMNSGGSKVGMATGFDVNQMMEGQNIDATEKVKFEKTGASKTISGYSCEEYKIVSEADTKAENQQSVWMTTDINSDWMQSMTKIAQSKNMFGMSEDMPSDIPQGTIIEMVTKDSKGNITMTVTVEEINESSSVDLKTTDYTFMNFGGQTPSK